MEGPPTEDGVSMGVVDPTTTAASPTNRPLRRRVCRTCGQHHASHEPHVYDYVEEVDEDVTCHICLQPLVTPMDTPCGHTFCKPCLLCFLKVQQSCPIDRKYLSQRICTHSSVVLRKILEKLKVKCPNCDQCDAVLQRGDMEDHLKYRCIGNWVSCPYSTGGCTFRGPNRTLSGHIPTCPFKEKGISKNPIIDGEVTIIEMPRTQTSLGIAIVGGADTPLRCVVIQEVFPDGLIAQDGRLQAGDQMIEINGNDVVNSSHHQVCQTLRQTTPVLCLGVYREDELMHVTLTRDDNRQLGIKLGGRRTEPGIFIMELMEDSIAEQDGRLQPHDRILAINGGDVRYSRLDYAFRLIKQSQGHVSLIICRNSSKCGYDHLFRRRHNDINIAHARTKSAPDRLVEQRDQNSNEFSRRSPEDVVDGVEVDNQDRSASCESLGERPPHNSMPSRFRSNSSFTENKYRVNSGSLGSLSELLPIENFNSSIGSIHSNLDNSSRSLASPVRPFLIEDTEAPCGIAPALPPRSRQPLGRTPSYDQLDDAELSNLEQRDVVEGETRDHSPKLTAVSGLPASGCADVIDGPIPPRSKPRKSRDSSDLTDLIHGIRKTLRIEGSQLHQKTVTISKEPCESLGMRIGGGVKSNEGDTPIYIANIHPQGPVGKSKQVKKGDILLSVNGQTLLGLTHTQAVGLLKATAELAGVTLSLLEGPETSTGPANFVPSWLYWQNLPRALQISKSVVLHRAPGASLGFSIVGGNDPERGHEPIHVLFVVSTSPAALDGKLRCGDRLLAVDGHSLESVSHSTAVFRLKQAGQRVHLEVVSWMGTEL